MGYHIILKQEKNKLKHHYVEQYYEMAKLPITETSIIYKGEKHWTPFLAAEHPDYKNLTDSRYRGSMLAERIFMKQALEKKYIIEILEQDQKSFKQYYSISNEYINIKRGDFLIRNVGNIEIEVKCKTLYWSEPKRHFYFEKEHFEKHLEMQKLTKTPVILAIYLRHKTDNTPIEDRLFMIDMNRIKTLIRLKKIKQVKRDWGESYQIKISQCMEGFKLIEFYRNKFNQKHKS